jgi:hypothetical protein
VSSTRSLLKAFERRFLRPIGRRLRGRIRRTLGDSDRVAHLEARVEELESLVRELTGLAYLRLDEDSHDKTSPRPPREAA